MRNMLLLAAMLVVAGCSSRSADDRVGEPPAAPARAGKDLGDAVVVTRSVPKYRISGNTVYRSTGQQPVYVYQTAREGHSDASDELLRQDLRLEAYLAALRRELATAAAQQPVRVVEDPLDPQRAIRPDVPVPQAPAPTRPQGEPSAPEAP